MLLSMTRLLFLAARCGSMLLWIGMNGGAVVARDADRVVDIWPDLAPGESTRNTGEALPRRPSEDPPATRVKSITHPRLHVFHPPGPVASWSGASVLIFPGGAYNYVVTDKEGSEAAAWMNRHGITSIVVHYRTKQAAGTQTNADLPKLSERPLQDGQRAVSLVRHHAGEWGLKSDQIGVLGFSAGGQAAALVTTRFASRSYKSRDEVDDVSCRPDFSMLVYPWRLVDDETGQLRDVLKISKKTPPTLLIHAHNDSATSISSVLFYVELKRIGVPAELHIYETGGHGYGVRPVRNSNVATWPARAADWLRRRGMTSDE